MVCGIVCFHTSRIVRHYALDLLGSLFVSYRLGLWLGISSDTTRIIAFLLLLYIWLPSCAVLAHWLWKRKQRNTPSTKEKHRAMSCCFFLKIFISLAPDNPTILSQTQKTQILEPINIHTLKTRCQCHPKIPKEFPKKKNKSPFFPLKIRQKSCIISREENYFFVDVSFLFVNLSPCSDSKCRCGGTAFRPQTPPRASSSTARSIHSQQRLTNSIQ